MPKVVFITGISSGLGKNIAEILSKKGHLVYGISRTSMQYSGVNHFQADVTDIDSVKAAVDTVIRKEGRIDILINNAGIGIAGPVEFSSAEDIKEQMNINFSGYINVIKSVLPFMRNQKEGMIINVSSIGGIIGLPFQGIYSASKFAIEGLSQSLRMELKAFNIKVVVIRPGDFCTGFTANRRIEKTSNPYINQFSKTLGIIESDERRGMKPDFFARKISEIIGKNNPRNQYVIASLEQKIAFYLRHILPDWLFLPLFQKHYGI